jgi:hypothetical protein
MARIVLIGWVVVVSTVDEAAKFIATDDDDSSVLERFQCRVPPTSCQIVRGSIGPLTIVARGKRADSEGAVRILVGIISRAGGERVSTRDDGLIAANIEQSTIPEVRASRAEGVCCYFHGPDLICGGVVLSSPSWVAIDGEWVVLYFVDDVDLVRSTKVELLGGGSGCTNLLETTDFVGWGEVGGLSWVLRVLALCESGPEGAISGCSGLDKVVNTARSQGGVPRLLCSSSNRREDEGGYYEKR